MTLIRLTNSHNISDLLYHANHQARKLSEKVTSIYSQNQHNRLLAAMTPKSTFKNTMSNCNV